MATRNSGEIRLCSNEYFTKNATPRKRARPPIHAKSFAPMNCSQSIAGFVGAIGFGFLGTAIFCGIGVGSDFLSGVGVITGNGGGTASALGVFASPGAG